MGAIPSGGSNASIDFGVNVGQSFSAEIQKILNANKDSGTRAYLEQQQNRRDTQNAFVTSLYSFGKALTAVGDAKDAGLRGQAFGLQLTQTEERYRDARTQLKGSMAVAAAANGVKVSGSVAESLTQSLTQLGLEEANRKFDIRTRQIEAERDRGYAKAAQAGSLLSGFGNMIGGVASYMSGK